MLVMKVIQISPVGNKTEFLSVHRPGLNWNGWVLQSKCLCTVLFIKRLFVNIQQKLENLCETNSCWLAKSMHPVFSKNAHRSKSPPAKPATRKNWISGSTDHQKMSTKFDLKTFKFSRQQDIWASLLPKLSEPSFFGDDSKKSADAVNVTGRSKQMLFLRIVCNDRHVFGTSSASKPRESWFRSIILPESEMLAAL